MKFGSGSLRCLGSLFDAGTVTGLTDGQLLERFGAHERVDRLPDRYRSPVILCDLEGRTYEDAARHLGCPVGTVKGRLARGRERLKRQLTRRGLDPGNALPGRGFWDLHANRCLRCLQRPRLVPLSGLVVPKGLRRGPFRRRWLRSSGRHCA